MGIYSNIVKQDKVRKVQEKILENIKDALVNSFGPYGSNTLIYSDGTLNKYTKDGHEILKGIKILFPIESSVQRDLVEITSNTVRGNGDGTTGAVVLSYEIFKALANLENEYTPYDLMREFKKATQNIQKQILTHTQEFNADMAYKIAMISTNGNEEVSSILRDIYAKHGNDVYITINITSQDKNIVKTYDGLTMTEGVYSSAYMNIPSENKAQLQNASIYYFDDPIDNPNMISLFETIVSKNIFEAHKNGKQPKATVILTPYISRDASTYIENIERVMEAGKGMNKPPLIIVNNIFKNDSVGDIVKMCGCRPIKKYIDLQQQREDIEKGLAPSIENVTEFCGSADMVVSTTTETKFINPKLMVKKNKEGIIEGFSDEYHALLNFIETEISKVKDSNYDDNTLGALKKRLHNLRANMVEYVIGGITMSDREALKALVEDAVLNCRSAAENGVGYGANYEGLRATHELINSNKEEDIKLKDMYQVIYAAYEEVQRILYSTMKVSDEDVKVLLLEGLDLHHMPYNMRTKEFDGNVLSSIMTDIVVLDGISKILTLLFTCNQFLVEKPQDNIYDGWGE